MKKHFSIAIDGPGGAGKSTLAKAVAKKLNILHVDTGAIYRTIGYAAFSRGLDAKDESQIAPLLKEIQIDMAFDETGGQKMLLDGKDVSTEIRLPEISMYASNVSALPCVRAYLLEMQRDIARRRSQRRAHTSAATRSQTIGTSAIRSRSVSRSTQRPSRSWLAPCSASSRSCRH